MPYIQLNKNFKKLKIGWVLLAKLYRFVVTMKPAVGACIQPDTGVQFGFQRIVTISGHREGMLIDSHAHIV